MPSFLSLCTCCTLILWLQFSIPTSFNICFLLLYVTHTYIGILIGFSQRVYTISEAGLREPDEGHVLLIDVHAQNTADRDYEVLLRILTANSTATVEGQDVFKAGPHFDAVFGVRLSEDEPIQEIRELPNGSAVLRTPLLIQIVNDFIPEDEECFIIQLSSYGENNFTCNDDDVNEVDYFCFHTICIEDDDG